MSLRDSIDKILEWVLIFLMSVLVIDVLWQVVSRYILINPSSFTTEVAGYLLIWVGILGAAYVAGKNEHLAIDLLLQKSSHKRRLRLLISIFIFSNYNFRYYSTLTVSYSYRCVCSC